MTTEDIQLPLDGSWLGIPLTTTSTLIFNGSGMDVYVRFGALSTSYGMKVLKDTTVIADETIYIRPAVGSTGGTGSLRVTR